MTTSPQASAAQRHERRHSISPVVMPDLAESCPSPIRRDRRLPTSNTALMQPKKVILPPLWARLSFKVSVLAM